MAGRTLNENKNNSPEIRINSYNFEVEEAKSIDIKGKIELTVFSDHESLGRVKGSYPIAERRFAK